MTITVAIDAVELPEAVQRGATTTLDDPVDVMTGWSGLEQRNRRNTKRPRTFAVGYGIKAQSDRQAIIDLYMTNGQLVGFLFRDPMDSTVTNQNIDLVLQPDGSRVSLSDGVNRSFKLFKTHSSGARAYDRRVTRPVAGTISVTVAGVATSAWTLNPLGEILFDSGHAPGVGQAVVVTVGRFLTAVRFVGKLAMRIDTLLKISVPTAQLMELFEV